MSLAHTLSGWRLAAAVSLLAALGACDRPDLSGPPSLRPGRDQCAACGMLIDTDRCAAAALVSRGGRREHLIYDDIGCMLDHRLPEGATAIDAFARDYSGNGWVRAQEATFVAADPDRIRTPMGSGIVAFRDRAAAEAQRDSSGGALAAYADLPALRAAARASTPRGPGGAAGGASP